MLRFSTAYAAAFLVLISTDMASASSRAERDEAARLRHARDLFRRVEQPVGFTGRCSIRMEWAQTPIDRKTARTYLRSNIAADLVASHTQRLPADVMDPEDRRRDWFCGFGQYGLALKEIAEARRNEGTLPAGGTIGRVDYTFPVFNPSFTRAVLVVTYQGLGQVEPVGHVGQTVAGNTTALVYEKRDGIWRFKTSELYAAWH